MTSSNNTNKYQGRVFEAKDNFGIEKTIGKKEHQRRCLFEGNSCIGFFETRDKAHTS